jgi:bifunctional UDP-N-acetylglucosamine pyrophosphorylase/glucosamine-1-phosphate N-acetyltransferase
MTERSNVAAVILAAGKGTRMRSDLPKVVHPILGRPVVGWVLSAIEQIGIGRTVVVIGHGAGQVRAALPSTVEIAVQEQQDGSGGALAAAMPELSGHSGPVLVVNGDGALFAPDTLAAVVDGHMEADAGATALAITSNDDLPYGRVIRDRDNSVACIVEAADATPEQLAVRELNAGVYCFDMAALAKALPELSVQNANGERYVTDLVGAIGENGSRTLAVVAGDERELIGINTRADLARAERILQRRVNRAHMRDGVTFSLANTILVEPTVQLEPDVTILPGTILRGSTRIAAGAVIGPNTELVDTTVGGDARVEASTCREAAIGDGATVGPYAYLRPGATLLAGAKAGTFVEIKAAEIGERAKVPHLSYIGDATIGEDTNIGAGTITANYRPELGSGKQRTVVGARTRTGSDNVFVAPVTIGSDAFTAAGSIVTDDVPDRSLAIARARQTNVPEYAQRIQQRRSEQEAEHERPDHHAGARNS